MPIRDPVASVDVMRTWAALDVSARAAVPPPDAWDLLAAALTDFEVAAIDDNARDRWRVYFHSPGARDRAAAGLRARFPDFDVAPVDVPDEDWAARSQAQLTAVRVGRVVVTPPWDAASVAPADSGAADAPITVVIQPSMGFGTGHHATTRLCLAHLQRLELRGCAVLDVGTGSGVLALAARRLGAARVLAIDDDPDAIRSARENVALNPGVEVTLAVMDLRRAALRASSAGLPGLTPISFEVVLANLTGAALVSAAATLQALSAGGGRLVLSGFQPHEEGLVRAAFPSCSIEARSEEDEWVCLTLHRSR